MNTPARKPPAIKTTARKTPARKPPAARKTRKNNGNSGGIRKKQEEVGLGEGTPPPLQQLKVEKMQNPAEMPPAKIPVISADAQLEDIEAAATTDMPVVSADAQLAAAADAQLAAATEMQPAAAADAQLAAAADAQLAAAKLALSKAAEVLQTGLNEVQRKLAEAPPTIETAASAGGGLNKMLKKRKKTFYKRFKSKKSMKRKNRTNRNNKYSMNHFVL